MKRRKLSARLCTALVAHERTTYRRFCEYNTLNDCTSTLPSPGHSCAPASWRERRKFHDRSQTYRRLKNNTVTLGTIRLAMDYGPSSRCLPRTIHASFFGLSSKASGTVFEDSPANHRRGARARAHFLRAFPPLSRGDGPQSPDRSPRSLTLLRARHFQSIG